MTDIGPYWTTLLLIVLAACQPTITIPTPTHNLFQPPATATRTSSSALQAYGFPVDVTLNVNVDGKPMTITRVHKCVPARTMGNQVYWQFPERISQPLLVGGTLLFSFSRTYCPIVAYHNTFEATGRSTGDVGWFVGWIDSLSKPTLMEEHIFERHTVPVTDDGFARRINPSTLRVTVSRSNGITRRAYDTADGAAIAWFGRSPRGGDVTHVLVGGTVQVYEEAEWKQLPGVPEHLRSMSVQSQAPREVSRVISRFTLPGGLGTRYGIKRSNDGGWTTDFTRPDTNTYYPSRPNEEHSFGVFNGVQTDIASSAIFDPEQKVLYFVRWGTQNIREPSEQ